jgi:hypothetical protein
VVDVGRQALYLGPGYPKARTDRADPRQRCAVQLPQDSRTQAPLRCHLHPQAIGAGYALAEATADAQATFDDAVDGYGLATGLRRGAL